MVNFNELLAENILQAKGSWPISGKNFPSCHK